MKKLLSRAGAIASIIACMAMVAQTSAYAEGGGIWALDGGGSISPGLTATPAFQSGTFDASVALGADVLVGSGVGTSVAVASGSCAFNFTSTIAETIALGEGSAAGNCSASFAGTSQSVTGCTFLFVRVGPLVVVATGTAVGGACTVTGTGPAGTGTAQAILGAGVLVLVPTSAVGAPVTSFDLAGAAVAGD